MKNELINNGKYQIFKNQLTENYKNGLSTDALINYKGLSEEEFIECKRIYNNNKHRKSNGMDYLAKIMFANVLSNNKNKLVMITLTFSDKDLEAKKDTRKQKVRRFLSKECIYYQANIDYGDKNGREHYHAVALTDHKIDIIKKWKRTGGRIEQIKNTAEDAKKVKNYIMKLNNHSYKNSTRLETIIRDRNNNEIMNKIDNDYNHLFKVFKGALQKGEILTSDSIKYALKNSKF